MELEACDFAMDAMPNHHLYMLTINLNIGLQSGIDLPGTVDKVRNMLCSYSSATRCIHKYKVTGEAKIVAVFECSNVTGLERMLAGIARLGNIDVCCKPLITYEKFSEMLQVDDTLTKPSMNCISEDKQLFLLEFNVEYQGKSMDELLGTWKREATKVLGAREDGVHLEVYKVVAERKVKVFIVMDPEAVDVLVFTIPVMIENGSGVTIDCHALQCLDDYSSRVSSEAL